MIVRRIIVIFCLFLSVYSHAQSDFYDSDSLREIRIIFYDTNWDHILDSLYVLGENERILADLEIDGNYYDSVGVRYKGFSSVSVNRVKNPFNIKLDYIIDNQDHQGFDKIKLSNVVQDPSFVREVLSYEIIRKYMPASQANYVNVYINDTLWGLYTNVEAVNKDFLNDNFGSKYSPFFKCNPMNLNIQVGGENSNLSNSHGIDSVNYYSYYDLESDYGWHDLYNLIDTLNNFSDSIHNILNIDRTLWMHALNYSMINFDSYIGYGQNYYLYKDEKNQWNPIIWDLNMSFGSFRLTDASQQYFSGFDIIQAQEMDPLTHHNYISVSPRPLLKVLFSDERYRKMYIAHIRTIIEENFLNQDYFLRGQYLQSLVDQSVQNDTNKFYSYTDFTMNLTNQVSIGSSICPGISQLMDARVNYFSSYSGYSGQPTIFNIQTLPNSNQFFGGDLTITAQIQDASYVMLAYRFGKNMPFENIQMYDDGNHNDGVANDGVYGFIINNCGNSVDYYLYADNDSAGVFSPERAAYEYYNIQTNLHQGDLVINELMSNNKNIVADDSGKYEDWIELYNNTPFPISTNGLFITDTITNLLKWKLPNYIVDPDSYFIIWADEDGGQGDQHANFQLSNLGETLILVNSDSSIIDSISYFSQFDDISFGRIPNGTGSFSMLTPTFNSNNDFPNPINEEVNNCIHIYPNPFNNSLYIDCDNKLIKIRDVMGKLIYTFINVEYINTSNWKPGVYFLSLESQKESVKIIKIK